MVSLTNFETGRPVGRSDPSGGKGAGFASDEMAHDPLRDASVVRPPEAAGATS